MTRIKCACEKRAHILDFLSVLRHDVPGAALSVGQPAAWHVSVSVAQPQARPPGSPCVLPPLQGMCVFDKHSTKKKEKHLPVAN